MTEPSPYAYPQDKVTITANYRTATDDLIIAGMPETVNIELNDDAVPADPAERIAFLVSLIDALFRMPADKGNYQIEVSDSGLDPDRLRELQKSVDAKGRAR